MNKSESVKSLERLCSAPHEDNQTVTSLRENICKLWCHLEEHANTDFKITIAFQEESFLYIEISGSWIVVLKQKHLNELLTAETTKDLRGTQFQTPSSRYQWISSKTSVGEIAQYINEAMNYYGLLQDNHLLRFRKQLSWEINDERTEFRITLLRSATDRRDFKQIARDRMNAGQLFGI